MTRRSKQAQVRYLAQERNRLKKELEDKNLEHAELADRIAKAVAALVLHNPAPPSVRKLPVLRTCGDCAHLEVDSHGMGGFCYLTPRSPARMVIPRAPKGYGDPPPTWCPLRLISETQGT